MAIVTQAQQLQETVSDTDGGVYSIPYRVVEDTGADLAPLDARSAAIAAGTTDVGIPPMAAPTRRESKSEVVVDLQFSLNEYRELVAFKQANPGGTYTPKIIDDRAGRVFPPQPFELEQAYEIIQKNPSDMPDSLVLDQRVVDLGFTRPIAQRQTVPIYPPQENFSRRLSIPASLLTDTYFFALSKATHKLNSTSVTIGGTTFPPQTAMLLSASLEVGGESFGILRMGFAVGEEYSETYSRKPAAGANVSETVTGIKPFSRLTYHKKTTEALLETPATTEYYGVYEHRVFPKTDISGVLPA